MERKFCMFDDNKLCDNCHDCEICDLDSSKICDNCGKCIAVEKDYETIEIDRIVGLDNGGAQ